MGGSALRDGGQEEKESLERWRAEVLLEGGWMSVVDKVRNLSQYLSQSIDFATTKRCSVKCCTGIPGFNNVIIIMFNNVIIM